ncbi:CBS domain-containing protein [Deinococcus humi]|uniref:CBS domain-containing protein n=1 Tax=Deinococcus humi TaxID=662880 RepID=A0A7W8K0A9_9DEIO|nr:CBS domain-containing protein [Deinococcus humi]MBB5366469.1 CBS domain-containing protein [Deinococcus humi]GGI66843.1 inosine-5-monophosphate dehydrogenase [Deinococcus humi]
MQVKDVMTSNPACCTPDTPLPEVARMMEQHDCGCIPVVEDQASKKPVGMITDRDIAVRGVAQGKDVSQMSARDCMSTSVVTVTPEDSVDDCCKVMEDNQVRRVAVVDQQGGCCGMVSQADVALDTSGKVSQVVREVSQPTDSTNNVQGQ